jgi:hypothetical protein
MSTYSWRRTYRKSGLTLFYSLVNWVRLIVRVTSCKLQFNWSRPVKRFARLLQRFRRIWKRRKLYVPESGLIASPFVLTFISGMTNIFHNDPKKGHEMRFNVKGVYYGAKCHYKSLALQTIHTLSYLSVHYKHIVFKIWMKIRCFILWHHATGLSYIYYIGFGN